MSIFRVVPCDEDLGQIYRPASHVILADLPDIDSPERALDLSVEKWDVMRRSPGTVDDGFDTCGLCEWQSKQPGGCDGCIVAIASIGCNAAGSLWRVYRGDVKLSRDTRGSSEDMYLFLLALRDGGVEAGHGFYKRQKKGEES